MLSPTGADGIPRRHPEQPSRFLSRDPAEGGEQADDRAPQRDGQKIRQWRVSAAAGRGSTSTAGLDGRAVEWKRSKEQAESEEGHSGARHDQTDAISAAALLLWALWAARTPFGSIGNRDGPVWLPSPRKHFEIWRNQKWTENEDCWRQQ